jgi:signal transduction histidine kinase/CheY-like chemotaxis protein
MISIFTPTSKVHMQRDVMRDTDIRLVKYSQRGIFLSLLVFFAVILAGEFYATHPKLTIIMGVGLLLISVVRGFFLYKFEYLYAQGPARWRNLFFCFSLLGSSWWGFIVAEITYKNGFYNETPVLWLYTVAFFAGSIYVFSPFERFLRIYMFVSFIPCSVVAITLLQPVSILYGIIMITLYILLCRQGRIIGKNYWDKLQATYDLLQRANALEAQRITTQSSLDNQDQLFRNVIRELKASGNEIASSLRLIKDADLSKDDKKIILLTEEKIQKQMYLLRNVSELSKLSEKNIRLDQEAIDIRSAIEQALSKVSLIAHKQGVELYSSFSSDFPARVIADNERIEQLIGNLIVSACRFSKKGELMISCAYHNTDKVGRIDISVINNKPIKTPEAIEKVNQGFSSRTATDLSLGLNLAIIKGLAEAMNGSAEVKYRKDDKLVFNVSLELSAVDNNLSKRKVVKSLEEKQLLVYQAPESVKGIFQSTLESWGLSVEHFDNEEKALSALEKGGYDGILFYSHLDNISALSLSKNIAEHDTLWELPQIFLLSQVQKNIPEVTEHFLKYVNIEVLYKPIEHRRLRNLLKDTLHASHNTTQQTAEQQKVKENTDDLLTDSNILIFQEEEIDSVILNAMLNDLGCKAVEAESLEDAQRLFSQTAFDAFICESHMEGIDMEGFVEKLRKEKKQQGNYNPPILGLTSHEQDNEETQCLACGMEYYIDSPTNTDDLKAILRRFIGRAIHMAGQKDAANS